MMMLIICWERSIKPLRQVLFKILGFVIDFVLMIYLPGKEGLIYAI